MPNDNTNYTTASKEVSINVKAPSQKPVAAFSVYPTSGNPPLTYSFTDSSTGSPISWLWDFGDGYTSTEQNPTHTYSEPGNYAVNLTAINANGTDSKIAIIKVLEEQADAMFPVANFSINITSGYLPLLVQFTDFSQNATGWNWDFGDGVIQQSRTQCTSILL